MYKFILALFFILPAFLALTQANHFTTDTSNTSLHYDTSRIAILQVDTTNKWLFKGAKDLHLTYGALILIDSIIKQACEAFNSKNNRTSLFGHINLSKHRLQYVPYIDSSGKQKIYVNAFCAENYWIFNQWRKQLVMADDGGACFFQLTINLKTKKVEDFSVNGVA